jgi:hypothetical protein
MIKEIKIILPDEGCSGRIKINVKKWFTFSFAKDFNEKNKKGKKVVHNLDPRKEQKLVFDVEPIPTTYFDLDSVTESWHIDDPSFSKRVLEFVETCNWENT